MNDLDAFRQMLRQQVHAHAREDLFSYTQLMFNEVEPSGTFIEANHTKVLATAIEKVIRSDTRRLLIAIPPRFGKSLLASVMAPTWMLGHDPSYKIVAASYGDELARAFAVQSRNIMTSRVYRELFPQAVLAAGGGAIGRLETNAGGYRFTTSVGGALTGKGADLVIVDDPLKAADAISSQAARDAAFNWITGTVMSRFDKPSEGQVIVLSQRLHMDDLIARLRDEGGWEILSVPAEALKPIELDIGEADPWRLSAGDLLFPQRFDRAALAQLRADLGEGNYAAQILQDPVALGGTVFKIKDIVIQDHARFDPAKMEAIYQSWDTAISENETAAWSVCTTWGIEGKRFALIDVFRQRLAYPQVQIDLVTEGRLVDIVGEGFDFGIRSADLVPSDMIAVRLGKQRRHVVVATPQYFGNSPALVVPPDLLNHICVRVRLPNGERYRWRFEREGQVVQIDVPGPITLDEASLARIAVLDNLGIGYFMEPDVRDDIAAGRLICALEDWTPSLSPLALYYPARKNSSAAFRVFVELARTFNASAMKKGVPLP